MVVRHHEHEAVGIEGGDLILGGVDEEHRIVALLRQGRLQLSLIAWVDQPNLRGEVGLQAGQGLGHVSGTEDHDPSTRPGKALVEQGHLAPTTLPGALGERIALRLRSGATCGQELARMFDRELLESTPADGAPSQTAPGDDHARSHLARGATPAARHDDQDAGLTGLTQLGQALQPALVSFRGGVHEQGSRMGPENDGPAIPGATAQCTPWKRTHLRVRKE